ncbi:hypothetical protein BC939DRAFT_396865 [Gamsiella multidivaricata]|uniref:uncharacterized protein n=1 Tax=Gamsiella multidivaricata TaxID=101098 RepID=UPI00221FB7D5|nr:uncharacterized protein BC939DRAFT_396865 [Gamsiella multidivaricata]KAI7824156.1 hypothetical protein BC939DRAFT_396865 [Gamsiella multidivaricata]
MASLRLATRALWSLKTIKAPVTSAPVLTSSQRLLHTSCSVSNEEKTEDNNADTKTAAAGAEGDSAEGDSAEEAGAVASTKLPYRRRNFHQWLQKGGARFATPSFSGPNFVGDVPFPMNPLFKPTPPISNLAKEEIYKFHCSDSTKWTPRFVAQEKFTKGMEQLMGVKAERSAAIVEPLTDILPQVGSPKFEALDEDQEFTAEDAAKVLKRRPLAEIKARQLEEEKQRPFRLKDSIKGVAKAEAPQTVALSRNAAESNPRFKFEILDTFAKVMNRSHAGLPLVYLPVILRHLTNSLCLSLFSFSVLPPLSVDDIDQGQGRHFVAGSKVVGEVIGNRHE